jgi:hypothetical protein
MWALLSHARKRQMQGQPTAAEQSTTTKPAPSGQAPDRTAGTDPAPTEETKRATAGAAQPAPSEKKVTADQDC